MTTTPTTSPESTPVEIDFGRDDAIDPDESRPSWWQRVLAQPAAGIGAGLLSIIIVFGALAPSTFLTTTNLRNLALDNSTLVIVALAVGIVIISGGFDLSAGSVIAVSQVTTALTFQALGGIAGGIDAVLAGLVVGIVTGTVWGLLNGFLVTRLKIQPFVATLATSGIALGVALVLSGGQDKAAVPSILVQNVGLNDLLGVPVPVIIAAVITLLAIYLLRRTRFGQRIYAIGSDSTAAARTGIPVARYQVRVYALAGAAYGLVAFLDMARLSTTTIAGYSAIALFAVSAVAIGGASLFGGTGTALGILIGVSIPAVLNNGLAITGIPSYYAQIGVGIALVLAVYADHLRRSASRLS